LSGFLAWWAWLTIHMFFLIHFENRLLILMQWAWDYWTRNRSARLITGEETAPQAMPDRAAASGPDGNAVTANPQSTESAP